jgi:hypothetical protein
MKTEIRAVDFQDQQPSTAEWHSIESRVTSIWSATRPIQGTPSHLQP